MIFEIQLNKLGKPYLKKVDRLRKHSVDGRGSWVIVGRENETGIDHVIEVNRKNGLMVLLDEDGFYRTLILTD